MLAVITDLVRAVWPAHAAVSVMLGSPGREFSKLVTRGPKESSSLEPPGDSELEVCVWGDP